MKILHVSDIHAQPGQPLQELATRIVDVLIKDDQKPEILVASGDLGFKGAGAKEGAKLIRYLAEGFKIPKEQIVCCPGNHEIEAAGKTNRFSEYFEAVTHLLGDAGRASPVPCALYSVGSVDFLIINSAYHHNHQYGEVHLHMLNQTLAKLSAPEPSRVRVAVVHHHSIPLAEKEPSHIRNAYEFLSAIAKHRFHLLLHGHRHMALRLQFGPGPTRLVGVGTVNFTPEANVNNQFNLIEVGCSIICYRYHADVHASFGMGHWVPGKEDW